MPVADTDKIEQCGETREFLYRKIVVRTSFIGPDQGIYDLASAQKKGTAFSGTGGSAVAHSVIESSTTEKIAADRSKWNVVYAIYTENTHGGGGGGGGDTDASTYYTEQDTMSMVQYQFPLYKYLNAEEATAVQAWENLPPEESARKAAFKYKDVEKNEWVDLIDVSEKALKVAKKLFAGVEYVQKAYPQVTHTERMPSRQTLSIRQGKLNHIDNAGVPNLGMKNDYSWLKVQFDWNENDDSTWTLTESWTGIPKENPWDPDLYGPNAWDFFNPTTPKDDDDDDEE